MDIDELDPATGNSVAIYSQKSLAECKILCESAGSCYSIHYHPFQNSAFNGCQLKYKIFTDQSQITNYDGTWTSYWLFDCSSGNLCCYYFFDIHIQLKFILRIRIWFEQIYHSYSNHDNSSNRNTDSGGRNRQYFMFWWSLLIEI